MIAKAWQAWLAAVVVIVGMLMLLVLREVGGDEREGFGGPRRTYDYDAPRAALLETLIAGTMQPRYTVARKDGWEPYRPEPFSDIHVELPAVDEVEPAPQPSHEVVEVRVTADGLAVGSGDAASDDLGLATLTIKHRIDPAISVELEVDGELPYERIIHVMDAIRETGIEQIALTATAP